MSTMKRQTRRITTRLRIERGEYVPGEGETVLMERSLSGRAVAVTVHRIKRQWEHTKEPGVTLLDATVTMRDIASGTSGAWLTQSTPDGGALDDDDRPDAPERE